MGAERIRKIVREKEIVERDLKKMNNLKSEAFKVFDSNASLESMKKSVEDGGAWYQILDWYYDASEHSGCFSFRHPDSIRKSFAKLSFAIIDRKKFAEELSEAREDIVSYIDTLVKVLEELNQKLDIAYYEFVQNETGEYKWIFEQPFMKEILLKFLTF